LKVNYRFHKSHNVAFRKPHSKTTLQNHIPKSHSQTRFCKIRVNMNQEESDMRDKLNFGEEESCVQEYGDGTA
jgi:hypothetical protein